MTLSVCFFTPQNTFSAQDKTGIEFVNVKGGTFTAGTNMDDLKQVNVAPFAISKNLVTCRQYARFLKATAHPAPYVNQHWAKPFNWENGNMPPGREDEPVVLVSWNDAKAFAAWAKLRLPTQYEWEKAALAALETDFDRHGVYFEWTQSNYTGTKSFPEGIDDFANEGLKVIRQGSFQKTLYLPARHPTVFAALPGERFAYVGFSCVKDIKDKTP